VKKSFLALLSIVAFSGSVNAQVETESFGVWETTYYNVKMPSAPGRNPLHIWDGAWNAYGYCYSKGYDDAASFTTTCGEDERTFVNYAGGNRWTTRDSGSKNQCYPILDSVTCRYHDINTAGVETPQK